MVKVFTKKLIDFIADNIPGSELRRCNANSYKGTRCIKQLNHWFRHEDAWRYKWNTFKVCKDTHRYDCRSERIMTCIRKKNHSGKHQSDMGFSWK